MMSEQQDVLLEQAVTFLRERGLRLPALIALEVGRPFTFFGAQLLWIAQPALSLFLPSQQVKNLAQLLEKPEAVAWLVTRLEEQ
jgi:hypothetical protein